MSGLGVSGLVVVGADGSASSLAAVETAAREARWRGSGLRVVHALMWPALHVPLVPPPPGPEEGVLTLAEPIVAEAEERARAVEPDLDVSHAVVTGEPLTVLVAQSREADLVVVGSRGMGGFAGLVAGSTAVHLAAHSRCPVLVVREHGESQGPVVLGVDGSSAGARAVEFAFAEATLSGAELVALHSWTTWNTLMPPSVHTAMQHADESGGPAASAERLLSEALAGHQERHPSVKVRHEVVHGGAREALIEASRRARLVVVGGRGRGGFSGLLLGSVSQAVLHHAHCPVAVVRGETGSG